MLELCTNSSHMYGGTIDDLPGNDSHCPKPRNILRTSTTRNNIMNKLISWSIKSTIIIWALVTYALGIIGGLSLYGAGTIGGIYLTIMVIPPTGLLIGLLGQLLMLINMI